MKTKQCRICQSTIPVYLELDLCDKCIQKKEYYYKTHYDVQDMSKMLGIGEEQVRRNVKKGIYPPRVPGIKRLLWSMPEIDEWRAKGQPARRLPQNPLQEKAYAMCRKKDHSWMADEQYLNNGYSRENKVDEGDNTITVGYVHTCFFCDHQEFYYF